MTQASCDKYPLVDRRKRSHRGRIPNKRVWGDPQQAPAENRQSYHWTYSYPTHPGQDMCQTQQHPSNTAPSKTEHAVFCFAYACLASFVSRRRCYISRLSLTFLTLQMHTRCAQIVFARQPFIYNDVDIDHNEETALRAKFQTQGHISINQFFEPLPHYVNVSLKVIFFL